jgi:hypothetical protein
VVDPRAVRPDIEPRSRDSWRENPRKRKQEKSQDKEQSNKRPAPGQGIDEYA